MLIYVLLISGFVLLVKGADLLVEGSSGIARKMGISPLVIGLTIVAFGTSLPEMVVNLLSVIQGNTDVALGNIIGSNICNILLILGLTATLFPIDVKHSSVWKEIPFSILGGLALFLLANDMLIDGARDSVLSRIDGMILLLLFVMFLIYVLEMAIAHRVEFESRKRDEEKKKDYSIGILILMIVTGLAFLILGGKWVVDSAVKMARSIGISEFLTSATIVAVGTSLPELVTSVVAAYKKEAEISVGNIVGSNIFNIFWIMGISSLIRPIPITIGANVDIVFLLLITLYLFLFMFVGKKYKLERWQGITFLFLYVCYVIYIVTRG